MSEQLNDHERRISTMEGEMKGLATKADLAELKHELMQAFQAAIQTALKEQTELIQTELSHQRRILDQQSKDIRELREKESRFKGAVDTLKIALPFLISIIAVLVAVFK